MRKFIFSIFLTSILTLSFSASAFADFYKFIDKEGNIRYTDDLNMVPQDQRASCRQYQGYEDISESSDPALNKAGAQTAAAKKDSSQKPGTETEKDDVYDFDKAYQRLEKIRTELDTEYKNIVAEKQELAEEKQKLTSEDYPAYNKKLEAFNEKVTAYEKKKSDYEALASEYNRRASQVMKKNSEAVSKEER